MVQKAQNKELHLMTNFQIVKKAGSPLILQAADFYRYVPALFFF